MHNIIAYLNRKDGQFFAKDELGNLREIAFGDPIFEGEVVVQVVADAAKTAETEGEIILEITPEESAFQKMPLNEEAARRLDTATSVEVLLPLSNPEVNVVATLRQGHSFEERYVKPISEMVEEQSLLDSTPVANPDTARTDEDFTGLLNGNVFNNGQSGDVADSLGRDDGVSQPIIGVQVGSTEDEVHGGLGNTLTGTYGTLVLEADGSYEYDLNENSVVTQALVDGQVGKDVFSYTITDSDGDTATTTLTINVIGADDASYIVIPPQTVYEAGLPEGTLADGSDHVVDKEIQIQAKDILDTVTIGGTTLTLAQLQDLANNNASIDTGEGTLTLTDYNFNLTGFVTTLTYTYALNDNLDHPAAAGNNTLEDDIAVSVVDVNGSLANGTLAITIVDDVPVTVVDTNEITEDGMPNTVSGNVYSTTGASSGDNADNIGADTVTPDTPVTAETIVGTYGTLVIEADGSYVYTLDNDNPVVNVLNDGDTLTENLTYTVTDNDGDAVTGTLEMTIHGTTDPVLIVDDAVVNEDDGTMTFTIRLEDASGNPGSSARDVTFDYATSDGTATAGADYTATNGSAIITAGTSSITITVPLIDDYIADNGETFDVTLSNVNTAASIDVASGAITVGTATMEDDSKSETPYVDSDDATEPEHEYVTLKLIGLDSSGAEVGFANTVVEGEAASYMVVLVDPDGNRITTATGTVNVLLSDGTAMLTNSIAGMPGDYSTLAINPVTLNTPFSINTTDDFTSDNGETFSVAIANDQSFSNADTYENVVHDTTAVTTTITDGPAEPSGEDVTTLSISGDTSVGEGATATYTLTVDHAPEQDLVVEVTISHISTDNADLDTALLYTQNVTILAGQTTATFTVDTLDDTVYEGSENYIVDISNVTGGQYEQLAIGNQNITTTIIDNETKPELSLTDIVVNEDGTATLTVTASGTAQRDIDFSFDTSDGTAIAGLDYDGVVGGAATIIAGTTSTTITVNLSDDYIADNGETFDVILSTTSPDAVISPMNGTATVTIEDDSKSGTPYNDADDGTENGHEYVTLKLIALDVLGNEVGLANSVTEGGAASYMVVAEDPNGARITTATGTVNVVVSDGTALATNLIAGMPGDYDGTSPIAVTLGTAFSVQTTDDFTADNGESFSVAIANDQSYSNATVYENVVHDTTAITTTIVDDVDVTTLSISGDTSVGEGATATYTLTVDHAPEQDLVVEVTISHISTDNADFDPALSYTQNITILAGQTTANFSIDNFDDTNYEGVEDYKVAITNTSGGSYEGLVLGTDDITTTIVDNETKPALSIDDVSVDEDAGTMTFTVSMTGTAQADVTFNYASSDQTPVSAEAGKDYSAVSGTGTIAAGATSTTITVPITDDYLAEGNETFEVVLSNPSVNATIVDATGVGTITDEVTPGVEDTVYVQLTGNASAVEDDAATLDHKLLLVDANGQPVTLGATDSITVILSYTSDTTESADFDIANGKKTTLTFTGADLTGANNNEYDFSNLIADDVLAEGTESYTLSIASVNDDNGVFEKLEAHQTAGSNDSVSGTISDDVNPDAETALVSIIGAQTIVEGETSSVYTVSVDQPAADVTSDINVAITYSGTATDGSDYTSVQNVTIAAGSNATTFTLDTLDDFIADDAETIIMSIGTITDSNFENIAADATANTVTSTIVDDTNPGTEPDQEIAHVSITGAQSIYEGDTSTPYTLSLDRPASEVNSDITVALTYSGIALDGTDYTGVASVTILAGTNSVDFSIATLDDALIEGSEDFTITLGSITDSNFESLIVDPSNNSVTSTIIDNVDAIDDSTTVIEGDNTITGNLLSNDETGDNGVISSFTYTKEDGSLGTGTVGVQVDTIYGLLTVEANGDYTYISDHNETHPTGNSLIDNINYTVTDANGKTDTALFSVDVTDGVDPVIGVPIDSSVDESALPNGTAPGTATATGSLAVSTTGSDTLNISFATAQSAPAGLTSDGKAITYNVTDSQITAVDSDGATVFTVTIDDPTNPASNYTFTLVKPLDNSGAEDAAITLNFGYGVVDQDGDGMSSSFDVTVNDDVPVAMDDTHNVLEDNVDQSGYDDGDVNTTVVAGNVFGATNASVNDNVDALGADNSNSATAVTAQTTVGKYGTLTLGVDGQYTYILDNTNPTVVALNDGDQLNDEIFTYTITDAEGDTDTAELNIIVDGVSNPGLSIDDITVNEDDGTATFTVTLSAPTPNDVTFNYASSDQTPVSAEAGKDYSAVSGTGTIAAGATSTTITVPITDDYLAEGNETFEVVLSNPSVNATIVDATGVGTITDEVTPGVEDTVYVQLTGNASAVEDDAATLDHKLLLVDANGQPVTLGATDSITVILSYTSDTTESADFDIANGKKTTLTFTGADLTGANNNEYDFSNLIADDVLAEGTESYTLSIASVNDDNGVFEKLEAHQTAGSNDSVSGTISDDVNPDAETALVSIIGAQTIVEGETSSVYTVSVDQPAADVTSDINVAITYSGTATDGSDYTSVQNVTIAAGSNATTFTLDTLDDFIADDAETIIMSIGTITDSNFENIAADATANTVTSTIVDDTNPGTEPDQEIAHVSITGAQSIYEGDTSTPYTLSLDRPASEVNSDITVALTYSGIALDGTDYTGVASVTILAGTNSVDFSIATLDDALIEGSEDFTITLGSITDSNFESLIVDPSNNSVTSTIIDNVDAIDDSTTVIEGDNTITGNLLSNDETGDNGVISSFTYTKEDGSLGTGTVGVQVDTIYGLLTVEANGDYTYISDHNETHPTGNSLIDNINYTVTDANGKTDTALFSVDVTDGVDPVIGVPIDSSVDESALPNGTAPGTATATGSLAVSTTGSDTLNISFATAQSAPAGLTSDGKAITYNVTDSQITAVDSDGATVFTVTIDDPTNPASNYTFTLVKPLDHIAPDDTAMTLDFTFDVVDQDGDSAGGSSFSVTVNDDVPTAADDTNTIVEDATPSSVSGSVVSNDTLGADANGTPISSIDGNAVVPGAATTVVGTYGTLLINADGTYSYTLDNSNLAVQDLDATQSTTETFTYIATDADGDNTTADLVITIQGSNDDVSLVVNDGTVAEAGLDTIGSQAATDSEKLTNQQFSFTALDGLKEVEIAGTVISATDLENLTGPAAGAISTGEGEITLTGYTKAADGTVTVTYDYILTSAQDHSGGAVSDAIDITVRDTDSDVVTQTINIAIVDDAPITTEDTASITEDAAINVLNGNVVTNDIQGADLATVTAIETVGGVVGTPDGVTVLTGLYGTLTMAADGTYEYTMDNTNPQVNALNSGESLNEVFNYTMTDSDGDTSVSRLTVVVNGANDAPVAVDHIDNYHEDPIVAGSVNGATNLLNGATDVDDVDSSLSIGTVNGVAGNVGAAVVVTLAYTDKDGIAATKDVNVTVNADGTYSIAQTDLDAFPDGAVGMGTLTYQVEDPSGALSGTHTLTINVAGDNDAPGAGVVLTETLLEDNIVAGNVVGTVNLLNGATDIDDASTVLTVGTINGDAAKVGTVVPTVLTYIDKDGNTAFAVVGITVNADGSYSVDQKDLNAIPDGVDATATFSYQIADDQGELSSAQTFTLHVSGQNDAGTLDLDHDDSSGVGGSDYQTTFQEGSGGVAIADIDTAMSDVDNANMQSATIVLTNPLGTDTFDISGVDPKFGATVTSAGGVITVTLSGDYSLADYEAAIEAVKYNNTDATPAEVDRTITVTLNDGTNDTNTATTTIHVDSTPTAYSDNNHVLEGSNTVNGDLLANDDTGTPTATVTGFTYTDETGTVLNGTIGIAANTQYGTITVNANGTYSYISDAHEDHDATDSLLDVINYTMADGNGDSSSSTLTIDMQDTIATVAPATVITLDEDDLPAGSTPTPADLTVSNTTLSITTGADPISDVKFIDSDVSAFVAGFTSGGNALSYTLSSGDHVLTVTDANAQDVFVVTINDDGSGSYNENSTYTFELKGVLDHPTANAEDQLDINVPFSIIEVNNANGEDTIDSNILVKVTDDVPTANDDAQQDIVEGSAATLSGNVLTGSGAGESPDTQGADGALLQDFSYLDGSGTPQTLTFSDGTDQTVTTPTGDLTINRDGTWSFVPVSAFDHDNNLAGDSSDDATNGSFTYTLIDADGDTDTGAQSINVTDGPNPSSGDVSNAVDEDDLGVGSSPDVPATTVTGNLSVTGGTDPIEKVEFTNVGTGTLTSNGVQIDYVLSNSGLTLTGDANGTTIFVATVTGTPANPTYSFDLQGPIDHDIPALGADENTKDVVLQYQATDWDGDSTTSNLTVTVTDDIPTIGTGQPDGLVDEAGLPFGSHAGDAGHPTTASGTLDVNSDADVFDTIFTQDTINGLPVLTSNGLAVTYTVDPVSGHHLLATRDNGGTTETVFRVDIVNPDASNASYQLTLYEAIDHSSGGGTNLQDMTFSFVTTDVDGDSATEDFKVSIKDDEAIGTRDITLDEDGSSIFSISADELQAGTVNYTGVEHGTVVFNSTLNTFTYTPTGDYSGLETFRIQATDVDGDTVDMIISATVNPVSDAPTMQADLSLSTQEDNSNTQEGANVIALGLSLPTLNDQTDQSTADSSNPIVTAHDEATDDTPERLGLITVDASADGAAINGTKIFVDTNGNGVLDAGETELLTVSNSDKNFTVKITDVVDYHPGDIGAADFDLTEAEYNHISVLQVEDNAHDITLDISAQQHEVQDNGNLWSPDIASTTMHQTVSIDVQAVTDPVSIVLNDTDGAGLDVVVSGSTVNVQFDEDTTYDFSAILGEQFGDLDGSESYQYKLEGVPNGVSVKIDGTTIVSDGVTPITVAFTTQTPTVSIEPPANFSGDINNITVTLIATDSEAAGETDSAPLIVDETAQVTLNLHVESVPDPVSMDTSVSTSEDTAVVFVNNLLFTDTDGSESLSGIEILGSKNADLSEWTVRDHNGAVVAPDGSGDYHITDTQAHLEAYTLTPPAHSSLDASLTIGLVISDDDGSHVNSSTFDQTLAVAISPVAETTVDSDGDGNADVTLNPDHEYATHADEDVWFDLNIADGGFALLASNEDDVTLGGHGSEDTTITFENLRDSSDTALSGAELQYSTDGGVTWVVESLNVAVEIPMEYLNTVQIKAPESRSGDIKVDMTISTLDHDEDDSSITVEALDSIQSTLTIHVDPTTDELVVAIAQGSGDEDAGREADGTLSAAGVANGIVLDVKVESLDLDGSEHINVYFDKIPEDAAIYYDIDKDGTKEIITQNGIYDPVSGNTTAIADIQNAPNNVAGTVPAIEIDAANHTWKLLVDNFTDTGTAPRDMPLIIAQHNSNEDIALEVSGYGVDSNGSVTVTAAVSPTYTLDVVIKGVADEVVDNEIYQEDITVSVDPVTDDLSVALDSGSSGKYSAVAEEDMSNTQVGAEFNLKDIYKTPDTIDSYDNQYSNDANQDQTPGDTSAASETTSIIITGLDSNFDLEGATLVGGAGTSRTWVTSAADIDAGGVILTTVENFSGEVNFEITYVTTEDDGDTKTSTVQDVSLLVTPEVDGVANVVQADTDVSEDTLTKMTFHTPTVFPDSDEFISSMGIAKDAYTVNGQNFKGVDGADFTIYLGNSTNMSLQDAAAIGSDVTIVTESGVDFYKITDPAIWEDLYVLYDADIGGVEAAPVTAHQTEFGFKFDVSDSTAAVQSGNPVTLTDTQSGFQNTANYTFDLSPVTDDITITASGTDDITDIDGDGTPDISVVGHHVNISGPTTINVAITINGVDTQNENGAGANGENGLDADSSEQIRSIKVSGVPDGIGIVDGLFIGNVTGQPDTGIWLVDIGTPINMDGNTHNYDLKFEVSGNYENATAANPTDITITVINQEYDVGGSPQATAQNDTIVLTFDRDAGFSGTVDDAPMDIIGLSDVNGDGTIDERDGYTVDPNFDTNPADDYQGGFKEDTTTKLGDIIHVALNDTQGTLNAEVGENINSTLFSITVEGLDSANVVDVNAFGQSVTTGLVDGWHYETVNGNAILTYRGSGDQAAVEAALNALDITPQEDVNHNNTGLATDISFTTTLTTYTESGIKDVVATDFSGNIEPMTDDVELTPDQVNAVEDVVQTITFTLDTVDNDFDPDGDGTDDIFTNLVQSAADTALATTISVTYNGSSNVGHGQFGVTLGGVHFDPNETHDVPITVSGNTVDLTFVADSNESGTANFTYTLFALEDHAQNVNEHTGTLEIDIAPVADGVETGGNAQANGFEDDFIQVLDANGVAISSSLIDNDTNNTTPEELKTVIIDDVPVGWLVYYGAGHTLAQNLGDNGTGENSWNIPLNAGVVPEIWVKAPGQVGSVTETFSLVTGVIDGGEHINASVPIDVSVVAVADPITMNPSAAGGVEGDKILLNFNTASLDVDGSEHYEVKLKRLGEGAVFYLSGVELTAAQVTYDRAHHTYIIDQSAGIDYSNIDNLEVVQNDRHKTIDATIIVHDSTPNDGTTQSAIGSFDIDITRQHATHGDDTLFYDRRGVNGFSGDDTVVFGTDYDGNNTINMGALHKVETFDLTQHGDHSFTISTTDVEAMTDSRNELVINTDAGDSITLANDGDDVWVLDGTDYVNNDGVKLTINGAGAIDDSVLDPTAGDDILGYIDSSIVDTGAGDDRLIIFDSVTTVTYANISNIETLDLSVKGDHDLGALSLSEVVNMTDNNNILTIKGDTTDDKVIFNAADNWDSISSSGGVTTYQHTTTGVGDPTVMVKVDDTMDHQII